MSNLYEWLQQREANEKPWRGTNEYPISKRTHRHKYFKVNEENGKKVYDVYYGSSYNRVDISNEDHTKLTAQEKQEYQLYPNYSNTGISNVNQVWTKWVTSPNKMLTIHDDNTVEFVKDSDWLHQGERGYLSQFVRALVKCESRRGGAIIYRWHDKKYIPVFKGLRISPDTLQPHPNSNYEIIIRRVARSQASEMLSKYENMFKVAETMCGVMDRDTFLQQTIDTMKDNGLDNNGWYYGNDVKEAIDKGMELLDTDPAGAFMLFAHGFQNHTFRQAVRNGQFNSWNHEDTFTIMHDTKKKLLRKLYKDYDTFTKTVFESKLQTYPSSVWGVELVVNGKQVEQYK